jgi:hypothetical protein
MKTREKEGYAKYFKVVPAKWVPEANYVIGEVVIQKKVGLLI